MTTPSSNTGSPRRSYADLLAAARATVAAHFDGDPRAIDTLIDHLDAIGELPAPTYWPTDAADLAALNGPVTARRIA